MASSSVSYDTRAPLIPSTVTSIVAPLHDMNIAVRHARGVPTDTAVETPKADI